MQSKKISDNLILSPLTDKYYIFLLIGILVTVIYFPIYGFEFTYDDSKRIKEEALVIDSAPLTSSIVKIFSTATFPGDLFRPLTTLGYRIQFSLFKLNPAYFHLFSIILHFSCCIFAFLILLRLGFSKYIATISSLLFAAHPINVESVASIAGQAELLSTFCGFLALFILFSAWPSSLKFILTTCLFLLSAFSKESGLVFPLLGFLLCNIDYGKQNSLALKILSFSSAACASIIYLISRYLVLGQQFFIQRPALFIAENPLLDQKISFSERILPAIQTLGDYLRLLLLPIHFSVDYSRGYELFWGRVYSFDGFISVILALSFFLLGILTISKELRLGVLWFFASFACTCNLITPIGTIMAERLCYLPSLGFCLVITAIILKYFPLKAATAISSLIILLFALRSFYLLPIWESDRILLLKLAELAPDSPKAQYLTGREYLVAKKDFERADYHLRQALLLDPSRFGPMRELANLALQKSEYGRAEYWIRKGLEIVPEEPELNRILAELQKIKGLNAGRE